MATLQRATLNRMTVNQRTTVHPGDC